MTAQETPWDRIRWATSVVPTRHENALRVLLVLVSRADDRGVCWPSQSDIATWAFGLTQPEVKGWHREKVREAVASLRRMGLVVVSEKSRPVNGQLQNLYRVLFEVPPFSKGTAPLLNGGALGDEVPPAEGEAVPPVRISGSPADRGQVPLLVPAGTTKNIHEKLPLRTTRSEAEPESHRDQDAESGIATLLDFDALTLGTTRSATNVARRHRATSDEGNPIRMRRDGSIMYSEFRQSCVACKKDRQGILLKEKAEDGGWLLVCTECYDGGWSFRHRAGEAHIQPDSVRPVPPTPVNDTNPDRLDSMRARVRSTVADTAVSRDHVAEWVVEAST
jgi:hypothetical protein